MWGSAEYKDEPPCGRHYPDVTRYPVHLYFSSSKASQLLSTLSWAWLVLENKFVDNICSIYDRDLTSNLRETLLVEVCHCYKLCLWKNPRHESRSIVKKNMWKFFFSEYVNQVKFYRYDRLELSDIDLEVRLSNISSRLKIESELSYYFPIFLLSCWNMKSNEQN